MASITGLARAHDTITGRIVIVPEAFLADGSPFPHLAPLPSSKRKAAKSATKDTTPSTGSKSRRSTTGRQTKAAAHNKE